MNILKIAKKLSVIALITFTGVLIKQLPSQAKDLGLYCNQSTVLSGFKFSYICTNQGNKLKIFNTYSNNRNLTIDGNVIVNSQGNLFRNRDGSISIISFPSQGSLTLASDSSNYYPIEVYTGVTTGKLIKSVSVSCNSGSKHVSSFIFSATCSQQAPRFAAQNNSRTEKVFSFSGKRGNLQFKNYQWINPQEQEQLDFSAIAKGKNFAGQSFKIEIREAK